MAKSTRKRSTRKPSSFPLTRHPRGYWCKKVRGKLHYFGKIEADPEGKAALESWLDQKDDLQAGRVPRAKRGGLTVANAINEFLNAKRLQVEAGEFSERSHRELRMTCRRMASVFGTTREVADLGPDDFALLRTEITKHCGPVRTKNEITRAKTLFRWAHKQGLIATLPRYGAAFDPPSAKTLRLAKAAKGDRLFAPEEILALLERANVQHRARILLALNCGFGASDIANLPKTAVDLEGGWIAFPRPKTGIPRRCWLWPETRRVLAVAMAERGHAADPAHDDRALLTRYGKPLVRHIKGAPQDRIAQEFRKLLAKADLGDTGLSFYRLRHTHRTVADECGDQPACGIVMGHVDSTMAGNYRQRVSDDRLRRVAETVRAWLYGPQDGNQADEPATVRFPSAG